MNIFDLSAQITLKIDEYQKNLKQANKDAQEFQKDVSKSNSKSSVSWKNVGKVVTGVATAITTATAAVVAFGSKMIDYAGDIDDNAQRIGMNTDQYQAWAFAMEKAGTDASTLQVVMRELSSFTQELADGNGDALLTLQKLGVGYDEFMQMDNAGQLETLVTALQGVEDSTEKATIAQELFGNRAYQQLMPLLNEEQGSFAQLNEELKENGQIVSGDLIQAGAELGDKIQLLTTSAKSMALSFAGELFPVLGEFADSLQLLIQGADGAEEQVSQSFGKLVSKVIDLLLGLIDDVLTALPDVVQILLDMIGQIWNNLPTITKALLDAVAQIVDILLNLDWGQVIIDIIDVLLEVFLVQLPQLGMKLQESLFEMLQGLFTEEGLAKLGKMAINLGISIANGLIQGLNNLAHIKIPGLTIGKWKVWDDIDVKLFELPLIKLQEFANGGMFDELTKGTMYAVAGESGAEIVAQGKQGTGVANVEQIAEAVEIGNEPTVEAIHQAVTGVVNGILNGLSMRTQNNTSKKEITVKIGDRAFKGYIVDTANEVLQAQGRQTLKSITSY